MLLSVFIFSGPVWPQLRSNKGFFCLFVCNLWIFWSINPLCLPFFFVQKYFGEKNPCWNMPGWLITKDQNAEVCIVEVNRNTHVQNLKEICFQVYILPWEVQIGLSDIKMQSKPISRPCLVKYKFLGGWGSCEG